MGSGIVKSSYVAICRHMPCTSAAIFSTTVRPIPGMRRERPIRSTFVNVIPFHFRVGPTLELTEVGERLTVANA